MSLTQDRLKEVLFYDPLSGDFIWKVDKGSRARKGRCAGTVNTQGYCQISIDGRLYRAHRLAFLYMTGSFPAIGVDHIDRDKLNNRWANLRESTQRDNQYNTGVTSRSETGLKGVSLNKRVGRYVARIGENYRTRHIGIYETADEAHRAYQKELKKVTNCDAE